MAEQVPEKHQARLKPHSLLDVLRFLFRYPGRVSVCLVLLLTNIAIELSLPQLIGEAIDQLRWRIDPGPTVQVFAALVFLRAAIGYLLGPFRSRLIHQTLVDLRANIYDAIQRLGFTYHDRARTGELISRSTTDVFRLQEFFHACLFLSVDIVVSLVVTNVLLFAISPLLAAVALGTMLPTIGLISFYASKLQPQWRKVHDLHGAMTAVVQENIAGVRVVKAFAKEGAEVAKFSRKRDDFLGVLMTTVSYWAARVPFAQFLYGLSVPLALWVGGREVIRGELVIGDLAKVLFYLMAIGHRMGMVGQFTNILQNAGASAERILEVIREPRQIRSGKRALPEGGGAVRFEHVSFHYPEAKVSSLEDVSFEVKPGQVVAVVGPTGSGKSTLVNLIPRFYDPVRGRVLVEGVDVRELDLRQLRRAVGFIFQDTFLFSATVAENIAFGDPQASREAIEQAAQAAQAEEFILELERGYDTVIGERGVTLSGGQKQRIAIARAFLMNPRILVMDDATSSVDSHTEKLIQKALRRLSEGRTTFIIAHRFSTVEHADLILVLNQGRIVERGTHAQLIQTGGFYAEIFEQQIRR